MYTIHSVIKAMLIVIKTLLLIKGAKQYMKNFITWLGKNKGAVATFLTGFLSISDLAFNWILGEKTIYVLGFNLLGVVGTTISIIIGVCTSGFHSVKIQDVMDNAVALFLKDKNNGLTAQERISIGKKINEFNKKKTSLTAQYKDYIDNVELYGIASSNDVVKYNEYKQMITALDEKINALKQKLGD